MGDLPNPRGPRGGPDPLARPRAAGAILFAVGMSLAGSRLCDASSTPSDKPLPRPFFLQRKGPGNCPSGGLCSLLHGLQGLIRIALDCGLAATPLGGPRSIVVTVFCAPEFLP